MTDVDDVLAVEREWIEAHQSGDFATIERLMAMITSGYCLTAPSPAKPG